MKSLNEVIRHKYSMRMVHIPASIVYIGIKPQSWLGGQGLDLGFVPVSVSEPQRCYQLL